MRVSGGFICAVLAVALGATPSAAGAATTPADALGFLNQQRAANAIPEVVANPGLNTGCANHNHYMALNGFAHGELPSKPGYTTAGAGVPNMSENLAVGSGLPWSATATPWLDAPLHEYLQYDARRTTGGYAEGEGFSCLRLTGELIAPAPRAFAFPGPDPLAVRPAVTVADSPFAPHQLIGLPARAMTGPNIHLYVVGLGNGVKITSSSLTGPTGPVAIGTVDQTTPGGASFFFGGGVMIPKQALQPGATYRGTVAWRSPSGRTLGQRFAFRTAGGVPVLGRSVLASAVSGVVKVQLPKTGAATAAGAGSAAVTKGVPFVPLKGSDVIPVGSFLDTRGGTIALTSATGRGTQAGEFSGAIFQVLQSRSPAKRGLTEVRLKGGSFKACTTAAKGRRATTSAKRRKRTVRRLRGSARGNYRMRGRGSVATIRGTIWTVADRCDGTLTSVKRGVVAVRDFQRRKTLTVTAGKRYLARYDKPRSKSKAKRKSKSMRKN